MLLYSRNDEATLALGALLAKHLKYGQVIALQGDLGAGKTVISRGVASGLGITEPVTSPTFTVAQEYAFWARTASQVAAFRWRLALHWL